MITNNYLKYKKYVQEDYTLNASATSGSQTMSEISSIYAIDNTYDGSRHGLFVQSNMFLGSSSSAERALNCYKTAFELNKVSKVVPSAATSFNNTDVDIANKISNISQISVTNNTVASDGKLINTVIATFNNTNESEITINSVGIYKNVMFTRWADTQYSDSCNILIAEILLNEPLIVPANNGFTITILWED